MKKVEFDPIVSPEHTFCPDWRELGLRHLAARRNYLYQMQKYGNTPRGRAAAEKALFHSRMATECFDQYNLILRRTR